MSEKEHLLTQLKEYADKHGKTSVARDEFKRIVSEYRIYKHFDSWNDFCREAGLEINDNSRIDDEVLLASMKAAFLELKGITTQLKFKRVSRYCVEAYKKRWGNWNSVLRAFKKWVLENDPAFPYLHDLPDDVPIVSSITRIEPTSIPNGHKTWEPLGKRQYGEIVNFRGLQHAPINEQGVVLLFGMLAEELGYVVESVTTGFPDCEAKRQIKKANRWERVRIEFEFLSRNFREHGHDPTQCELIVCWEHNWPDCPLEVLELKSVINTL